LKNLRAKIKLHPGTSIDSGLSATNRIRLTRKWPSPHSNQKLRGIRIKFSENVAIHKYDQTIRENHDLRKENIALKQA
jgi:hypothetical protein